MYLVYYMWPRLMSAVDVELEGILTELLSLLTYYSILQRFVVVLCSRQLIGPVDWGFVTLGPLHCA